MTMIAISEVCSERPVLRLTIAMPNVVWAWLGRRRERRLMAQLSRLSPHMIRDIGLDPDEVYDAVAGTWDEVVPGRPRVR